MNRRYYCIRRNPGSGRWVMYFWDRYHRPRACYVIMGSSDTLRNAVDGIYE